MYLKNYDRQGLHATRKLKSSGLALLFSHIFSVNNFLFHTALAIAFVFHHRLSAILVIEIIPRI